MKDREAWSAAGHGVSESDETATKAQQAEHRIADAFRLPPV